MDLAGKVMSLLLNMLYAAAAAKSLQSWLCVTPQTATHQASLFLGLSRQKPWSGLPFPSLNMLYSGFQFPFPGDLPDPGPKPVSPASPMLAGRFFTTAPPGKLFSSSGLSNAMPVLITPYTTWCCAQGSWPDCQMVGPRLPWCPQQREHHIPPSCHYHMLWMPPATLLPLMQMDHISSLYTQMFSLVMISNMVTRPLTTSQQQPVRGKDYVPHLEPLTWGCGP